MNKILIIVGVFFLASCGPSQEEKKTIALNACSIMGATDASFGGVLRMQTMIDAREKIGEEAFVGGSDAIAEAFEWELCQELVLNDENYNKTLQSLKDAHQETVRYLSEKKAKEDEIAAEKKAKEDEIAAKTKRLAMTCLSEGKEIKWSFRDSILYFGVLPFPVDDESVKKKSGEDVFLFKAEMMEYVIDFDKKRQVISMFGMEFESVCF
jgi:hypothetical protein